MDPVTLALIAFTLAKPFLEKTQEGIARKIGEDIWSLIKKPFEKNSKKNIEDFAKNQNDEFLQALQSEINSNPEYAKELLELVNDSQNILSGNFQQNINSHEEIGKQINIQQNIGNISM